MTVEWPSCERSMPRNDVYRYQLTKAPTVAKPTYVPTSIHLHQECALRWSAARLRILRLQVSGSSDETVRS